MTDQEKCKRYVEALVKALYAMINLDEYLSLNPDVSSSGMHPIHHFIKHGWRENRQISSTVNSTDLMANSPSINEGVRSVDNHECITELDCLFDSSRAPFSKNEVRFIGYVEAKLGLGIAARNTISCYELFSSNFSIYPYNHGAHDRFDSMYLPDKYDTHSPHKINIFELGLDNIGHAWKRVNKTLEHRVYNILKLYWELSEIPTDKIEDLNLYDEIWVPSRFVYDAVIKVFKKKIFVIPPFVDIRCDYSIKKNYFGLKEGIFHFLFSFDYNSSIFRKNPVAVVKAFQAAFPKNDHSVGLVIKSNDPVKSSIDPNMIRSLKNADARIIFIEDYLDRQMMLSLINCCDCYVSLHRSEGYGMGIAESICLGRKVVATNYSGNVDFMNQINSLPVDYKIVPLESHQYYLASGNFWAEPHHESAVQQLRAAYRNKDELFSKIIRNLFLYRSSIPSKSRLSRMISARIAAIMREKK